MHVTDTLWVALVTPGRARPAGPGLLLMTQPSSPQDPGRGNLIRIRNLRAAALNGKGLAAALPAGFNGRWTRRHWMHASLFAMLGTLVMAIVPGFSNPKTGRASGRERVCQYV